MDTKTIIALLIGASLFVSCQKEVEYPQGPIYEAGPQTFGWSTSEKNGLPFESSGYATRPSEFPDEIFGVQFLTYTDWGALREFISIGGFEYRLGRYEVVKATDFDSMDDFEKSQIVMGGYSTLSDDGDVLEDFYTIDSRGDNWAVITAIDTIDEEVVIRGAYNLHFKFANNRDKINEANPDHVRFTDGVFEVRFWN